MLKVEKMLNAVQFLMWYGDLEEDMAVLIVERVGLENFEKWKEKYDEEERGLMSSYVIQKKNIILNFIKDEYQKLSMLKGE